METNVERARRSAEGFASASPDLEMYAEDFQLRNLPDAPWQPSPGAAGIQEWLDFSNEITEDWSIEIQGIEELDASQVLVATNHAATFQATGIHQELEMVSLVIFREDGKILRIEAHYTHEQALAAAGLS